jgi:uncharacterized glyoxalase superfamily protein PhnB
MANNITSKQPPKGWPRISASVRYREAQKAIDFLCAAFGFEIQLKVDGEGGKIEHSELTLGGGLIMIGDVDRGCAWQKSPIEVGGANTQTLCIHIDDVDAHCERARKAGATIMTEPKTTDYGEGYWADRTYECIDPEGHHWYFMQRVSG